MSVFQRAPAYVSGIQPYIPGKPIEELAREMGFAQGDVIKLASNENPLGMSPMARQAMNAALDGLAQYPDGNGFGLKQAIARKLSVESAQVVLGNGSNDILELVARTFLAPGTRAVFAQHAFAVYALATQTSGAAGIEVPARAFSHDLAAMADAIDADTRVVFLANPNNPTGSFLPASLIEAFLRKVPEDVLVVLDEAYNEFLPQPLRYDAVSWIAQFPNLIVLRTFSKIYGLAGLRVGYGVSSHEVADLINRVRAPFNVNTLALAAAEAALGDHEFVALSCDNNQQGMAQLIAGFDALNLRHLPSVGNFIAVHVGDGAAINQRLLQQGVIVRPLANYGMPEWLRITVGLPAENARFLAALALALKG